MRSRGCSFQRRRKSGERRQRTKEEEEERERGGGREMKGEAVEVEVERASERRRLSPFSPLQRGSTRLSFSLVLPFFRQQRNAFSLLSATTTRIQIIPRSRMQSYTSAVENERAQGNERKQTVTNNIRLGFFFCLLFINRPAFSRSLSLSLSPRIRITYLACWPCYECHPRSRCRRPWRSMTRRPFRSRSGAGKETTTTTTTATAAGTTAEPRTCASAAAVGA